MAYRFHSCEQCLVRQRCPFQRLYLIHHVTSRLRPRQSIEMNCSVSASVMFALVWSPGLHVQKYSTNSKLPQFEYKPSRVMPSYAIVGASRGIGVSSILFLISIHPRHSNNYVLARVRQKAERWYSEYGLCACERSKKLWRASSIPWCGK